jgi:hypothetical protein
MKRLLAVCLTMLASTACAAPGDTAISVSYKVHSTRVRPSPTQGDGAARVDLVLHANGTVDDVVQGLGDNPKKWELKKRKLGDHKTGAVYRVIDSNTIERTSVEKTHIYVVRIAVEGKSCRATLTYTLRPGHKEFESYSPQLGVRAYYSALEPFDVQCKIE